MKLSELWYPSDSSKLVRAAFTVLLWPLSFLYRVITQLRRWLYRLGILSSWKSPVPVVVVGNISVGGTGKTPLVIALVDLLQSQGWKPGVVSRGYGGTNRQQPLIVQNNTSPSLCGDEPALVAQRTGQPVCVCVNRALAVQYLLSKANVNIIVCDDGLQHYALQRDIEIAVVDRDRQHGNQRLLPAGPLREPVSRLRSVDFIVESGDTLEEGSARSFSYRRVLEDAVRLDGMARQKLQAFSGTRCHALAGIGFPQRFFDHLEALGIELVKHPFPDHHAYTKVDLQVADELPVLMTEKDAVKCRELASQPERCWVAELHAELPEKFNQTFLAKVDSLQ